MGISGVKGMSNFFFLYTVDDEGWEKPQSIAVCYLKAARFYAEYEQSADFHSNMKEESNG